MKHPKSLALIVGLFVATISAAYAAKPAKALKAAAKVGIPAKAVAYKATISGQLFEPKEGYEARTILMAESSAVATCKSVANNHCVILKESSKFLGCEIRGSLGHECKGEAVAMGWYSK